jgi:hypothetical protein
MVIPTPRLVNAHVCAPARKATLNGPKALFFSTNQSICKSPVTIFATGNWAADRRQGIVACGKTALKIEKTENLDG